MDDDWGYPHLWKPQYDLAWRSIFISEFWIQVKLSYFGKRWADPLIDAWYWDVPGFLWANETHHRSISSVIAIQTIQKTFFWWRTFIPICFYTRNLSPKLRSLEWGSEWSFKAECLWVPCCFCRVCFKHLWISRNLFFKSQQSLGA